VPDALALLNSDLALFDSDLALFDSDLALFDPDSGLIRLGSLFDTDVPSEAEAGCAASDFVFAGRRRCGCHLLDPRRLTSLIWG
jgi:hypothetical protein